MSNTSWTAQALCRGSNVNFFFPDVGVSVKQTEAIRKLCSTCPVQNNCLELGLEAQNDEFGFFGGKSPRERQAINAQRKRQARHTIRASRRIPHHEPTETLGMGEQEQTSVAGCGIVGGVPMGSCPICPGDISTCARPVRVPCHNESTPGSA